MTDMSSHPSLERVEDVQSEPTEVLAPTASEIVDLLLSILSDQADHPEIWAQMGQLLDHLPDLPATLSARFNAEWRDEIKQRTTLLLIMCFAARGQASFALENLEPLMIQSSQSAQVQGAAFYIHSLLDPTNPKYQLHGKLCPAPFIQLDVLETSSHLCCASWLQATAGDLSTTDWQDVWNSEAAQLIRASVHDGSYRYCNKMACPKIQGGNLTPAGELAGQSDLWSQIVAEQATMLPRGPEVVNLAYDRTCNLSCPSCRSQSYAADEATRLRYDDMQQRRILPLLRNAKTVFITGSGDPFASKNFRRLMTQLTAEEYPELGFQIMTNGMLFTSRQWANFPALHGRTRILKISIDAATGPTHELLRRGARWPVMLENMAFAGQLTAEGQVAHYELVFTVQTENYREMGDAVDLAKSVGATGVYFARLTNWGTFTDAEYQRKAVFLPGHPHHEDFVERMQDARLQDPIVLLGDMSAFVRDRVQDHRIFQG